MVYSFDIFDTLITRTTYTPKGIFSLIQNKLKEQNCIFVSESLSANYCDLRVYAEQMASRMLCKEITLDDIYETFGMLNNVNHDELEYLKQLEIRTEKENIIGIKENIDFFKNLKKNGVKLYLISDMYLSAIILKDFLLSIDEVFNDIDVLVSCDLNKSKRKGDLFSYFLKNYDINNNEWTHIGDNIESDIKMVKNLGGNAIHYQPSQKTSFLCDYYYDHDENESVSQIVYGAIRRIVSDERSMNYNIGASIAGPVLHSYVLWIIKKSQKLGIKHLFFYARDGFLLKTIADIIINKEKIPIKTHYLYGSRITWYTVFDYTNPEEVTNRFLCTNFSTISQILNFFNVSLGELNKNVHNTIIMDGDYNKPLSNFERIYIKNCLIRGNFIDTYLEEQKKIYENVKGYLLQEIPKSGEVAFVDLQGTGKSQKCMKMFFEKIGYSMHIPVTAFYYAFYPLNMVQRSENIFFTYSNKIFPIPGILEVLARAPHGQTIDYKYKCGKWIPVFSDVCDYPDSESFQDYKNGIVDYVKNLDEANLLQTDNYRKLADRLLFKLGTYPDVEMQNFIGEMQFESDFDGNIKRFAPKLNDTDIKKIYKNGFCDTKDYNGCSFAFSSLRMSEKQRLLIAKSKKIYAQNTEIDKKENNVLKLEKKLIIYGMGKRGLVLYNELSKRNDIEIVLLVDKNYISKDSQNLNVSSVEKILETEFDYIVISVVNETVKKEILNNLLKLGIQREVILI